MKKKLFYLLCLIFTSGILKAQVNDSLLFEMSLEELMDFVVVSASKSEQKMSDAPSTIYVVSAEQIKLRGYTNLEEVLEDIPEIEIQRKSATEFSNLFSFRGVPGNDKFLVLQNGIRIASLTGTAHAVANNYSVMHAKRIEIILGPASALYGADAFTGIVNIITEEGKDLKSVKLNSSYGRFNTMDNSFVVGNGNDEISIMASGKYYYSDEPNFSKFYKEEYKWYEDHYKNNGEMQVSPYNNNVVKVIPKEYSTPTMAYFFNTMVNFKNVEIGFTRNFETHNTSVAGKPEFNVYDKSARYDVLNQILHFKHNYNSKNNKWNINSIYSHSYFELAPESKFINTFTAYGDGYKFSQSQKFKLDEQFSYNINEKNLLLAGFTFETIHEIPKTGDLPFKFDKNIPADLQHFYYMGTNVKDTNGNDMSIYQDFYNVQFQNYGGYLQWQSKLSKYINVTLGGRYDYNTRYGSTINPRAGLILKPLEKLNVKLLFGKAYLAPSPYVAYQHYGAFVPIYDSLNQFIKIIGPYWHLPNPDLKPEEITTYEASISYFLNDKIGLFVNGYYNDVVNLIEAEGKIDKVFKGLPIDFAEVPVNKGKIHTYGGTFRVNAKHKINSKSFIDGYIAYSYSDGRYSDTIKLAYSAQNTIKAGIDFKYNIFSISPRVIYRTASIHGLLKDKNGDYIKNEPFALLNITAICDLINKDKLKLSLFVKVINALDSRYYNLPYGKEELFNITPQDPLKIMGGINITL